MKNPKASILATSLIIMGLMIVIALGIAFSSLQSRKSSIGASKSSVAFQAADSGIEVVMQKIKDHSGESNLNNIDDDSGPCDGEFNSSPIGKFKVELKDNSTPPEIITDCNSPVSDIVNIKSIGYSNQDSRAIEVAIISGSGTSKIGVFRNGTWYLDTNGSGAWEGTDTIAYFGASGDIPIAGDWNGSGTSKIGVFRNGTWYLDTNGSGAWEGTDTIAYFGASGDIPIAGDWNGSGTSKIGVFRDVAGTVTWLLDTNGNGGLDAGTDTVASFGATGDLPVAGDWNGSGTSKIGVFRNGTWYLDTNGSGAWEGTDTIAYFGASGDIPIAGDWNGSGTSKIGVFRDVAGTVTWLLDTNGNGGLDAGTDTVASFGATGDLPVAGAW